jgi:ubiquinone/menaquinone biosynthesis C-methylase UbiE
MGRIPWARYVGCVILNGAEKALMNNPVRSAVQRVFEARRLLAMGGPTPHAHVLEVGCGRGVGTDIILDLFKAARVDACDLDSEMVRLARERLARRGDRVRIRVGDVEHIEAGDGTYDAVFDFGVIHHVPDWQAALREIARVLRPGGRFYAEEMLRDFIDSRLWRRLLDHPREDRFDAGGFVAGLEAAGLRLLARKSFLTQAAWFVARKPEVGVAQ